MFLWRQAEVLTSRNKPVRFYSSFFFSPTSEFPVSGDPDHGYRIVRRKQDNFPYFTLLYDRNPLVHKSKAFIHEWPTHYRNPVLSRS